VADLLNKILPNFCKNFMKVKEAKDLTIAGTKMNEAMKNLREYTNKNNKLYEQENDLVIHLQNALDLPIYDEPKRLIVRTKIIRVKLDDLSNRKWIWGSVFVGAGTAKYWEQMATHCNGLANALTKQVKDQEAAEKSQKNPVLSLEEAQEKYGKFSGFSKSAKRAKVLTRTPEFFGDKYKTWKDVFDILPKSLQNRYCWTKSEKNYKIFIWNVLSDREHCGKDIYDKLSFIYRCVFNKFLKCQKVLTGENIDNLIKDYIQLRNFASQYKDQHFYNCLLFSVQDIEYRTFQKLDLAIPENERKQ
jgi:hypothetical protein